ncbi:unnamed protein product [Adineta steineri]|uniref:nicotinamidase n=1 Tax=Adineta steineri TaxID=433720 RepID=A0A813T000_9BILA|nr:unnamed protein product [Adineta steineri]
MHTSLLVFSIFLIGTTLSNPVHYDQISKKLTAISEQIDQAELRLNNSITKLLSKLDSSNHDLTQLIKSIHTSRVVDNSQSSNQAVSALLVIDVQYDFIDGSLALKNCPSKHNGEEVIPVINQLLDSHKFDVVAYSHDWHPTDHISFFDNLHLRSHLLTSDSIPLADLKLYSIATFAINGLPRMEQSLWPRHCVQNTHGAKLHSDLKVIEEDNAQNISVIHIQKGTKPDVDSYSAFWDNSKLGETQLNQFLKEKGVTQVFVVGLATDWCVYSTAIHGMEHGYKTFIIEDACRGVDEKTIKERLNDFTQKNGHIIKSSQVKDYIQE